MSTREVRSGALSNNRKVRYDVVAKRFRTEGGRFAKAPTRSPAKSPRRVTRSGKVYGLGQTTVRKVKSAARKVKSAVFGNTPKSSPPALFSSPEIGSPIMSRFNSVVMTPVRNIKNKKPITNKK